MNTFKLIRNHTDKLVPLALSTLKPGNFRVLMRNFLSVNSGPGWEDYFNSKNVTYTSRIDQALEWILHSQKTVGSGGVGCYEFYRWTTGYPEVTGYIIPTVLDAYHRTGDKKFLESAVKMGEWELGIQREDGGWEGFYQGDGKPSIVFNTGQVIRGMIALYKELQDERYLNAAVRAADWIISTQDEDGSWTSTNFKQMKRVYDTYVTAPISKLYKITGNEAYLNACVRNCDFILTHQRKNGWFELADNTLLNNAAPVLHTISYTIDGLIETGENLEMDRYIDAAQLATDALLHKAEIQNLVPARFDENWRKAAGYSCLTGNAQLGIIFIRFYERTKDKRYMNAALKLADFLGYTQELNSIGKDRDGAIAGSYPIWGMYCPLKLPSWATKYYIDLLVLIKKQTGLE